MSHLFDDAPARTFGPSVRVLPLVIRSAFAYNPQLLPLNPRFSPTTFIRRDDLSLPSHLRLAADKCYSLWSLDECHFQQHGTRCRMWVPPELKDPVLLHAPTRKSIACFGAVSLVSGKFVRSMCERFDASTFETFLKKLLRHRPRTKRMMVVLDNARYHHAVLLAPLLKKYRKVLTLLFLPPYSPQLAPIERVWKLARRMATHNRFFATLNEVLVAVGICFDRWQKPNPVLKRLCGII